jgi:glycosyltransferase involved in cell wall biosynthesis
MNTINISIIIPAFNEEAAISEVVAQLKENFPKAELLVVDDGSTDATARLATEAGASIVSHKNNQGYGAALRSGIFQSSREYVLFCDADGQHRLEDIKRVIDAGEGYDMVVGARTKQSHTPLVRAPGKFILIHFANFLAGEKIPDLNSGLRLLRRETILKYLHLMPRGFSFSTTSTFAMLKGNYAIDWVPIEVRKRLGTSTVRQLKHGPQTLLLILRLTVLFEPLKVFLSAAVGVGFFSLISLIIDISVNKAFNIGDTTVLLSLATLLIFMFGLLCDQVSAIRREIHEQKL